MDNLKKLKRGEMLFKEGDTTDTIWVVQSGRISVFVERSGKKIEIDQVSTGQVLGVQSVFGRPRRTYSAEASNESKVMEIPAQLLRQQYESAQPGVKLLLKGLADGHRLVRETVKTMKLETDNSPCPQLVIPKLFSILTLVADHSGEKQESGAIQIPWTTLRIYTSRMFLESHIRMQSCLDLLVKLKHADLKFQKNDEGEDELNSVTILNPQLVEDFCEFYQYNLYKGGRAEVIYVDELALKVTKALVKVSEGVEADRRGITTLEYNKILEEVKTQFRFELKNTHLDCLERKGLFVKRQSRDDGSVFFSFDRNEFVRTLGFWEVIREIDKWNQKGFVDLNEKEVVDSSGQPAAECPQCKTVVGVESKFCSNCGAKLAAAA